MFRQKLLIATHNPGKFNEFKSYFERKVCNFELYSLKDLHITYDVEETGKTFEENAALKALKYAQMANMLTLADDGGLQVDALNGEPGIYSSRYAGPYASDMQKAEYLLNKLTSVSTENRKAQFICVLTLADSSGVLKSFKGELKGSIAPKISGRLQPGLPYCLVLVHPEFNKTLAQLHEEGIFYQSHRKIALDKLIQSDYLKG